jgi:hypothetical protein
MHFLDWPVTCIEFVIASTLDEKEIERFLQDLTKGVP